MENETNDSRTGNQASNNLTMACVGDDRSQLLENTLCEIDGGDDIAPNGEEHSSKRSTFIQMWDDKAQQIDQSEHFTPFHKRISSIRIDDDPSSTGVGHATHSNSLKPLDQTAKCIEEDRPKGEEVGTAAFCHVNQSENFEWVRQFEPMNHYWTNPRQWDTDEARPTVTICNKRN